MMVSSLAERIQDDRLTKKIRIIMDDIGLEDVKPPETSKRFLKKLKYLQVIRGYPGISVKVAKEFIQVSGWKPSTSLQGIGLKYGPNINRNIDRRSVERVVKMLKLKSRKSWIMGSYRRGKEYGIGDVDILVYDPEISGYDFNEILKKRLGKRYIVAMAVGDKKISILVRVRGTIKQKYSIIYPPSSEGDLVQLDIRFARNMKELPFLLLYFTGSREFSIGSRIRAIDMGLKLNEYGLFNRKTDKRIKKSFRSEKDIIRYLGMNKKYYDPSER